MKNQSNGFAGLGLPAATLNSLRHLGFHTPTPIQQLAIPVALEGKDVLGIAQTGTGKTLAFGLPLVSRIRPGKCGLVIAPTRELAQQIQDSLRRLGLSSALLIGGAGMVPQVRQLRSRPQVIIATPGRLLDHMNQRTVDLRNVDIVVLDEADRMLDMGFLPSITKILEALPHGRQTMLFTATMPNSIVELARSTQRDPVRLEVESQTVTADNITQELLVVAKDDKQEVLGDLLGHHSGSVLVFARTRHSARKLTAVVRRMGHSAAEIHSDRTLFQRRQALDGFKSGDYRILIATDIAARGIDVQEISVVINYDLPTVPEDYVHRIGRTGRAGASGLAITMASPEERRAVEAIEEVIQQELAASTHSRGTINRRVLRPRVRYEHYEPKHHHGNSHDSRPNQDRKPHSAHRPERKPFGENRPDRPAFGDNRNDRKPYGPKPNGDNRPDRPSFGDNRNDRKPYGDNRPERKPYGPKPEGQSRPAYSPKPKPQGSKDYGPKPFGKPAQPKPAWKKDSRPAGNRPHGPKPQGAPVSPTGTPRRPRRPLRTRR
ncbi:MAG: DEAD/DEAH box helicase [Chthonomonas sp.]|nr:DEAD/DEAH box helicase [Chthonomonas sp.]